VSSSTPKQQKSKDKGKVITFSSDGHGTKTLGHGLLSLGMLFIGISQSPFRLLGPAKHSFLRLLCSRLGSSRNIVSFSRSIQLRL
jgi:hypothetical protein